MTTARPRSRHKPPANAPTPAIEAQASEHLFWISGERPDHDFPLGGAQTGSSDQLNADVARQAMRWTYVLRSRRRWVSESAAREQNERLARDALHLFKIEKGQLEQLAENRRVVVRIPWTGNEAENWQFRILPWEYLLAAATRQDRLKYSRNGRPPPLTVMRELSFLTPPDHVPAQPPLQTASSISAMIVECLPPELREHWDFRDEYERLRKAVPNARWRILSWPTPEDLTDAIRVNRPQFIHFAGFDSHQGLKELRRYVGSEALIDLGPDTASASDGDAQEDAQSRVFLIDEVAADRALAVDGVLLQGAPYLAKPSPSPNAIKAVVGKDPLAIERTYPRLVPAHTLAKILAESNHCAFFVSFNLWNSAARIAPLVVAEQAAMAAVGFQDAFDDGLAEYVHALMYENVFRSDGNVPLAFENMWTAVRELPESVDATGITLWAGSPLLERHSSAHLAVRPSADNKVKARDQSPKARKIAATSTHDARVRVNVKPISELNYAVLHNARPLFEHFVLECDDPSPEISVDVDVAVHMGMEVARYQRRLSVDARRMNLTNEIHVPLTAALMRGTHEAISSSIVVQVKRGADTLYCESHRLRFLPIDQWRDTKHDGRWLPSFVLPRDPAVPRAVELAQRYIRVLRDDPHSGFEGYQIARAADEPSLRGIDRQVEAIWAALLHDWQLGYINPPPTYSAALDSQRLRWPSNVLQHRSGTCIDLALLFAACLEYVDIYPVVFLLHGHALPGWWRHPDFRDEYLQMPQAQSAEVAIMSATENPMANAQSVAWHTGKASWPEIRRWIRQRKLVPIETVRLTERGSFVEAIESGVAALAERRDFDSMLEIITARQQGVTPLPVRGEHQ